MRCCGVSGPVMLRGYLVTTSRKDPCLSMSPRARPAVQGMGVIFCTSPARMYSTPALQPISVISNTLGKAARASKIWQPMQVFESEGRCCTPYVIGMQGA